MWTDLETLLEGGVASFVPWFDDLFWKPEHFEKFLVLVQDQPLALAVMREFQVASLH